MKIVNGVARWGTTTASTTSWGAPLRGDPRLMGQTPSAYQAFQTAAVK
ncbi:MAG: hypothetical protein ACI8P0_005807 [Planctomycetaceae bacterium]